MYRHPLTQRSISPHGSASTSMQLGAEWIEEKAAGVGRIHVPMRPPNACVPIAPHRSVTSASLAPQANDLVFERPGGTCSAQMRIRISSRMRLGTRAVLPFSEYHSPIRRLSRTGGNAPTAILSDRPFPSNSTLASGIWPSDPFSDRRCLYARRSLPPRRSVMYEMHCNYQKCPPPMPAFCSCTTRNAMCSRVLDAPYA
ncbi:hypothetical protein DFH08DRAFT_104169 [Mycena albidolilacea]|uniref:Uncharacterized protein n=1 Tax=Mycena albidolilacea TaxID=1033008 RepID=A0AAD6YXL5_9AGAR|nr:hypothetical protein DFH08DRAFT_104169 [Mycena albidolilacea]